MIRRIAFLALAALVAGALLIWFSSDRPAQVVAGQVDLYSTNTAGADRPAHRAHSAKKTLNADHRSSEGEPGAIVVFSRGSSHGSSIADVLSLAREGSALLLASDLTIACMHANETLESTSGDKWQASNQCREFWSIEAWDEELSEVERRRLLNDLEGEIISLLGDDDGFDTEAVQRLYDFVERAKTPHEIELALFFCSLGISAATSRRRPILWIVSGSSGCMIVSIRPFMGILAW